VSERVEREISDDDREVSTMANDAKPSGFQIRTPTGRGEAIGEDDTEGQSFNLRRRPGEGAVEDDTEGQMLPDLGAGRVIAHTRESQIRQHLSRHDLEDAARRPHRKEK
jgi:hypothetical protein